MRFYNAFAHLDPATMAQCYAPEAQFRDEVFSLDGRDQVMSMWFMLCESLDGRGRVDWKLNYRIVSVDAQTARLHWSARYHFGPARATGVQPDRRNISLQRRRPDHATP